MIQLLSKLKVTTLVMLALALMFSPTSEVYALGFAPPPATTNKQKAHLNINFTGGGNGGSACNASDPLIALSGANNLEKIFNYFTGKSLSPEQAAGVVGNIAVESGGNPINAQVGPDTKDPAQFGTDVGVGRAWGLIQWDAGGRAIKYAEQANITTPIYELATQLEIVWWHMNNTSPTGATNMYQSFQRIAGVEEATQFYEEKMEGAGIPHMDTRIERAKEALRAFGGGSDASSSGTTTETVSCTSDTGDGGIASVEGFTFPLITTQTAIKKGSTIGSETGIWCYSKQTNCHHDYKAADLMISTGTTVIAAKAGKVQNINGGNQHPNNVTITSSDGKGINYYTHMGANTVSVRVGQHVEGGTVLGKVGTSVDAMGTAPHLHFDMLPSQFSYRPSCSGSACSSYPFIEVQPALIETFKKLPE